MCRLCRYVVVCVICLQTNNNTKERTTKQQTTTSYSEIVIQFNNYKLNTNKKEVWGGVVWGVGGVDGRCVVISVSFVCKHIITQRNNITLETMTNYIKNK